MDSSLTLTDENDEYDFFKSIDEAKYDDKLMSVNQAKIMYNSLKSDDEINMVVKPNGAPVEVIDYNSHKTSVFKQKKGEFETMTNIPIEDTGNDYSFEKFNEIASKDIALLKETDDLSTCVPYVFPKKIKDKYKDSNVVHFDNDGYFSFSFGIPMPK